MAEEGRNSGWYILGVLLLILGVIMGLRLPDIDLTYLRCRPWIIHRSILTHGILVPGFLFWLFQSRSQKLPDGFRETLRLCLIGILIGSVVHLGFDLFPKRWIGWALIYIPLYRWASPLFSQWWIAVSLFVCPYLGCCLLRSVSELRLALCTLCLSYAYCAEQEPRILLPALFALIAASCIAFLLPRPSVNHIDLRR